MQMQTSELALLSVATWSMMMDIVGVVLFTHGVVYIHILYAIVSVTLR